MLFIAVSRRFQISSDQPIFGLSIIKIITWDCYPFHSSSLSGYIPSLDSFPVESVNFYFNVLLNYKSNSIYFQPLTKYQADERRGRVECSRVEDDDDGVSSITISAYNPISAFCFGLKFSLDIPALWGYNGLG